MAVVAIYPPPKKEIRIKARELSPEARLFIVAGIILGAELIVYLIFRRRK